MKKELKPVNKSPFTASLRVDKSKSTEVLPISKKEFGTSFYKSLESDMDSTKSKKVIIHCLVIDFIDTRYSMNK